MRAMMKNFCEVKDPVLILVQPFQLCVLYLSTNHCCMTAWYQVVFKVTKYMKPHSIAKELIKPHDYIYSWEWHKKKAWISATVKWCSEPNCRFEFRYFGRRFLTYESISFATLAPIKRDYWCFELLSNYYTGGTIKFLFCEELKTTTNAAYFFQFVKDSFTKHQLDIESTAYVCANALLPRWKLNLSFFTDEIGYSTLASYSLFLLPS